MINWFIIWYQQLPDIWLSDQNVIDSIKYTYQRLIKIFLMAFEWNSRNYLNTNSIWISCSLSSETHFYEFNPIMEHFFLCFIEFYYYLYCGFVAFVDHNVAFEHMHVRKSWLLNTNSFISTEIYSHEKLISNYWKFFFFLSDWLGWVTKNFSKCCLP